MGQGPCQCLCTRDTQLSPGHKVVSLGMDSWCTVNPFVDALLQKEVGMDVTAQIPREEVIENKKLPNAEGCS